MNRRSKKVPARSLSPIPSRMTTTSKAPGRSLSPGPRLPHLQRPSSVHSSAMNITTPSDLVVQTEYADSPDVDNNHLPKFNVDKFGNMTTTYEDGEVIDKNGTTTGWHYNFTEGGHAGATMTKVQDPKDPSKKITALAFSFSTESIVAQSSNNEFRLVSNDEQPYMLALILGNSNPQYDNHKKEMLMVAKAMMGGSSDRPGALNRIGAVLKKTDQYNLILFKLPALESGQYYTCQHLQFKGINAQDGQLLPAVTYPSFGKTTSLLICFLLIFAKNMLLKMN